MNGPTKNDATLAPASLRARIASPSTIAERATMSLVVAASAAAFMVGCASDLDSPAPSGFDESALTVQSPNEAPNSVDGVQIVHDGETFMAQSALQAELTLSTIELEEAELAVAPVRLSPRDLHARQMQGSQAVELTPELRAAVWQAEQNSAGDAYDLRAINGGVLASNVISGFDVVLADDGELVLSGLADGDRGFDVALQFAGIGRDGDFSRPGVLQQQTDGNRVTYEREDGLNEWYVNGPHGLEQGFTVAQRPDGDGDLSVIIDVDGDAAPQMNGADIVLHDGNGALLAYNGLFVTDASGAQLDAELAVDGDRIAILVDDSTAVYPIVIDPWVQQAQLASSQASRNDFQGYAVAIDGDTAVVGAYGNRTNNRANSGAVYVFERDGAAWVEQAILFPSDGAAQDFFGLAVAIDGDTVVAGAYLDDHDGLADAGSAYVFTRAGTVWTQAATLTAGADALANDWFGYSVSVSQDTVVVGTPASGAGAGAAYVFVDDGAAWVREAALTSDDGAAFDNFGYGLGVSGDVIVVGAWGADEAAEDAGAAYVFERTGTAWSQVDKFLPTNPDAFEYFGTAVAVDATTIAVGSYCDSDTVFCGGSVFVYDRATDGTWGLSQELETSDLGAEDWLGYSISIEGTLIVAGAPFEGDGVNYFGAAYVFRRAGGTWVQRAKFVGADTAIDDDFGLAVSVTADTVIVGAPRNDASGANSGSAYIFALVQVNGEECEHDGQCTSGFCTDGVCCDTLCDGECDACVIAITGVVDGVCAPSVLGTTCGDATATDCNAADSCNGVGACVDNIAAAGDACGDNTDNACTAPDSCDAAGTCVDNHVAAGEACGDQGVDCNADDECDGSGVCTDNGVFAAGTACGDNGNTDCTAPDACDDSGACLANHIADGTACDTGDFCITGDTCDSGACADGDVDPCGDGEKCIELVQMCIQACGDGVVDAGEVCDLGPANSDVTPNTCRTTCVAPSCGDNVVDLGELCDEGADNSDTGTCRLDCSVPTCGDGVVDADEQCDDGAANSDTDPDACRVNCSLNFCGDGVRDTDEACDEGAANSNTESNACRTTCDTASCGDSVVDSGESCDEGANNSNAADATCRLNCGLATCGDGVVDSGEECDDGVNNGDDADTCRTTCTLPTCGDAIIDTDETCDDGADNSDTAADACRLDCVDATCGDGVTDDEEECDEGDDNADDTADACSTECIAPACGDGLVDEGEECDLGDDNGGDECDDSCVIPGGGDVGPDTGDVGPDADDVGPDADDVGPDADDVGPDTDDTSDDITIDTDPDIGADVTVDATVDTSGDTSGEDVDGAENDRVTGSGCDCTTTPQPGNTGLLALVGLAGLVIRRRRRAA